MKPLLQLYDSTQREFYKNCKEDWHSVQTWSSVSLHCVGHLGLQEGETLKSKLLIN